MTTKKILKSLIYPNVEADIAEGKYDNWVPVPKPPLGKIVNMDEQAFETLCGGVEKAQRLFRIYKNSYGTGTAWDFAMGRGRTKEQVFLKKACEEGFTVEQARALLRLQ